MTGSASASALQPLLAQRDSSISHIAARFGSRNHQTAIGDCWFSRLKGAFKEPAAVIEGSAAFISANHKPHTTLVADLRPCL